MIWKEVTTPGSTSIISIAATTLGYFVQLYPCLLVLFDLEGGYFLSTLKSRSG